MAETLGKSTLDLSVAGLSGFDSDMKTVKRGADDAQSQLDALEAVAKLCAEALKHIKMDRTQTAETRAAADGMNDSLDKVTRKGEEASETVKRVKMYTTQAEETDVVGDAIDLKLKEITRNANETRRALESVKLAGTGGTGGAGGGRGRTGLDDGRNGVGLGPFGSGFGRIGVLGAAVGAGVLGTPAAGPGILGLLATSGPALAGIGGTVATLALAFQGVGAAIGGDKKAFDALQPSQQRFVLLIRSLTGWLDKLKQLAGQNVFAGFTKGLQAALSNGTVTQITRAVTEFGKAIGDVGVMVGKYLGSAEFQSIFGPLMKAGATNLKTIAKAALSLLDAFGVLSRAAIPLTTWLTNQAAAGAKWIDTMIHAKDASGGLTGAMREARTSLTLVGNLVKALGNAVGKLGIALYPVSKVAVKDLTDGLNGLAKIIDRNKTTIRDIVGGALAALKSTVKALLPFVAALATNANKVAKAVGGWKRVFEVVFTIGIAAKLSKITSALTNLGTAAGEKGAAGEVATLSSRLKAIAGKTFLVTIALALVPQSKPGQKRLNEGHLGFLGHLPLVGNTFQQVASATNIFRNAGKGISGDINGPAYGYGANGSPYQRGTELDVMYQAGYAGKTSSSLDSLTGFDETAYAAGWTARGIYTETRAPAVAPGSSVARVRIPASVVGAFTRVAHGDSTPDTSVFGKDPAFTKNLGPKAKKLKHPTVMIPVGIGGSASSLAFARTILGQGLGSNLSGTMSSATGVNLIPDSLRLLIDKARGTLSKTDDVAAYTRARNALEAMTKSATSWTKIPLADEIANLSQKINALTSTFDGFDLTLQERKRHLSDLDRADLYMKDKAPAETHNHYSPTIHTSSPAEAKREQRKDFFRYRVLMNNAV